MAFAVLFMHSIIPHHHHDEEKTSQHSNTDNDDDDDDFDGNPLSHAFGSFHHDGPGTVIYETASSTSGLSKVNIDKASVLLVQHFIGLLQKPPLIHWEHALFRPIPSPYSATKHFRGPPSVVA